MAAESVPTGKYRSALDVATRLAKEAGGLIRAQFLSETGVAGHGGHADVDTAAERLIRAGLALAFPDHGRRGEVMFPNPQFARREGGKDQPAWDFRESANWSRRSWRAICGC